MVKKSTVSPRNMSFTVTGVWPAGQPESQYLQSNLQKFFVDTIKTLRHKERENGCWSGSGFINKHQCFKSEAVNYSKPVERRVLRGNLGRVKNKSRTTRTESQVPVWPVY